MNNFETKKQQHLDFWCGKRQNLISVMGGDWFQVPYNTLEEKWLNPSYRLEQTELYLKDQWYGEDCIPHVFVNYGPGILAACLGGNYELLPNTVWFDKDPIIRDWDNAPELKVDFNSSIYQNIKKSYELLLEHSDNRYIVSVTDWGGVLDVLSGLRGTLELLQDYYDYPDMLLGFADKIFDAWLAAKKEDEKIFAKQGFTHWIPVYADKSYQTIQCDISAMISPEMFKKFAMPTLRKQVDNLNYSIYHLDGQEAEKHLDMILDIEKLDGIQYVPSDFNFQNPGDEHHFPLYEKILNGGKKLALTGVAPDKMVNLFQAFPDADIFATCCMFGKDEARRLDEEMEKFRR